MSIEIKKECLVEGIELDEFITYLGYKSGGSAGYNNSSGDYIEIFKPPSIGKNEIKVIYGKKHQVKRIQFTGKKYSAVASFIEKMHLVLLNKTNKQMHYSYLYSSCKPVKGFYRNNDFNFQIIEIPEESPKPDDIMDDHPFILQYPYYKSGYGPIDSIRREKAANSWESFCINLFDGMITKQTKNKRWVWGIDEDGKSWTKQAQDGYYIDNEHVTDENGFFISKNSPIELVAPEKYYNTYRSIGTEFQLPSNISYLIENYYNLSSVDKEVFLRAAYWLLQSATIKSSSLSYTALAFSLESLLPDNNRVTICPLCKTEELQTPVNDSVSNQIRSFISEYTNLDIIYVRKLYKNLYGLRSKIAHGSHLMSIDNKSDRGMSSQYLQELDNYNSLRDLLKIILYNWFIRKI